MNHFAMPSLLALITVALLMGCGAQKQEPAASVDPAFESAARGATNRLGVELKAELTAAMKLGGPVRAVTVCNERAAEIGSEVAATTGLDVHRVSQRNRSSGGIPDPVEAAVLAIFEARPALDDTVFVREGAPVYMRAIRINSPACLECHGDPGGFDDALVARLDALYPDDRATGFAMGELRGAFVVRQGQAR